MSHVKGFGITPDLSVRSLCVNATNFVDEKRNVNARSIEGTNILAKKNLTVKKDTTINGDLIVKGNIISTTNEKIIVTNLDDPAANVWIELPSEFQPEGIVLLKNACTGNVVTVNETTGNVLYNPTPNSTVARLDLFQYEALKNNIPHTITNFICQPPAIPPFANGSNITTGGWGAANPVYTQSLPGFQGTNPIDYNTWKIVIASTFTAPFGTSPLTPFDFYFYGTNLSPNLEGPGLLTYSSGQTTSYKLSLIGKGPQAGIIFEIEFVVDRNAQTFSINTSPKTWPGFPTSPFDLTAQFVYQVRDIFGLESDLYPPGNAATLNIRLF